MDGERAAVVLDALEGALLKALYSTEGEMREIRRRLIERSWRLEAKGEGWKVGLSEEAGRFVGEVMGLVADLLKGRVKETEEWGQVIPISGRGEREERV